MQQIADWLEKLGMSEYAERFAENDIDISVLPHLSDSDLKELGVSLGHRRKMLAAIAKREGGSTAIAPTRVAESRPPSPVSTAKPVSEAAGERRHVVVMFCDLVELDRHRGEARCRGVARSGGRHAPEPKVRPRNPPRQKRANGPARAAHALGSEGRRGGALRVKSASAASASAAQAGKGPPAGAQARERKPCPIPLRPGGQSPRRSGPRLPPRFPSPLRSRQASPGGTLFGLGAHPAWRP